MEGGGSNPQEGGVLGNVGQLTLLQDGKDARRNPQPPHVRSQPMVGNGSVLCNPMSPASTSHTLIMHRETPSHAQGTATSRYLRTEFITEYCA